MLKASFLYRKTNQHHLRYGLLLMLLVVVTFAVTACEQDEDNVEQPDPLERGAGDVAIAATSTVAMRQTQQAILSGTFNVSPLPPTDTLVPAQQTADALQATESFIQTATAARPTIATTPLPTDPIRGEFLSPTPTDDPVAAIDPFGTLVYDETWQSIPFQDTEGNQYSVDDFAGQVVFIMPFTTDCQNCIDMHLNVRSVARRFREEGRGYELAFISLNTNPGITTTALRQWAESLALNNFSGEGITWLITSPSAEYSNQLVETFGREAMIIQDTPVIIVDKEGRGRLASEGVMSETTVRDLLVLYHDSFVATEEAPEDLAEETEQSDE
jgi:hypothetical protein